MSDDALADRFDERPLPSASPARPGNPLADSAMALVLWVPWTWKRRSTLLKFFEGARQLTVNVGVLVLGMVLTVAVILATQESIVIVNPIAVPKDFDKDGYSATVLAQHLIDRVQRIGEEADTLNQKTAIGSESQYSALAAVEVPSAGFSVRSVISTLRELTGIQDNRVSGDLTLRTEARTTSKYALSLRMDGPLGRKLEVIDGASVDEVLDKAALIVTERVDPYTFGLYLIGREKIEDAERIAIGLVSSKDPAVRKWGHYLKGEIARSSWDDRGALREYELAIGLDAKFVPAMVGQAYSLASLDRPGEAQALAEKAHKIDLNYGPAHVLLGALLFAINKREEALAKFHDLPRRDPRPLYSKTRLALAYVNANELDLALQTCKEAIVLNSKYAVGYGACGVVHHSRREWDEAAEMFKKAVDLGNRPSFNHIQLGHVAAAREDYRSALKMFMEAARLNPKNLDAKALVADALAYLQSFDDAIVIVLELVKKRDEPHFRERIDQYQEWRRPF